MTIPKLAHFCWIGSRLPWAYAFAVLSAAARGGMDEVILHHTDELEDGPVLRALRQTPGIRLSRTDPLACLAPVQAALGLAEGLTGLYDRLSSPVMRADVLRAAILYSQGGIYLDLDTLTVAPLSPLLGVPQFIGQEYIVWPHWVRSSRSPLVWARHLTLDVMRKAMRRAPQGWRAFRLVQGLYFRGVNNAVMGGVPGAPLFEAYLRAMAALPPARLAEPYALGPDLLQAIVERGSAGGADHPCAGACSTRCRRKSQSIGFVPARTPERSSARCSALVRTWLIGTPPSGPIPCRANHAHYIKSPARPALQRHG